MRLLVQTIPLPRHPPSVAALLVPLALLLPSTAESQGNPIGPEFRVNSYTTDSENRPQISADASGNFVIIWSTAVQYSFYDVMAQRYAASGAPAGGEFRVNAYTTQGQYPGGVAYDLAGNFVVVWTSDLQDGSNMGVFARRFSSAGAPLGPEFRVNTYTTNIQGAGGVAADAAGNFVITWSSYRQNTPGGTDVYAQRFASSGTPLGPEFRVNTYTFGFQDGRVASDPSGNFVIIWQSYPQDGSGPGIYGQRFASSGVPLGPEFRVNTYTTGLQRNLSVSANAGGFVVVWESYDGTAQGVFAQRYAGGVPAGPEFRANTYTTGNQGYPFVTSDGAGNFVVAWQDQGRDGSGQGIFAQRFASSGAPDGPEFRVNTYTTNDQRYPALAADGFGNFIVTWDSQQDGSGRGVFGQRYGGIFPVDLMHFRVE